MKTLFSIIIPFILLLNSCSDDSITSIEGIVRNNETNEVIENAFIFHQGDLLATTNAAGEFKMVPLSQGTYELLFSAIGFGDNYFTLVAEEGKAKINDIYLRPGSEIGSIVGELQNNMLFEENLVTNPSMAEWSEQEIIDGVTGATIMKRTLPLNAECALYIGDSLMVNFDDYGQYWAEIQAGTYPLMVRCTGYKPSLKMVKIEADSLLFINFFLSDSAR